jgi:chromosome segregation ATPase
MNTIDTIADERDNLKAKLRQANAKLRKAKRELAAAKARNNELQRHIDETATKLLSTVNDRNSLGNQIDLLRDEFMRIEARIAETGLADRHCQLRLISGYCNRAQNDIPLRYPVIAERDRLDRELSAAKARIARLEEAGDGLKDEAWPTMFDSDASRKRRMDAIDAWTASKEAKP